MPVEPNFSLSLSGVPYVHPTETRESIELRVHRLAKSAITQHTPLLELHMTARITLPWRLSARQLSSVLMRSSFRAIPGTHSLLPASSC